MALGFIGRFFGRRGAGEQGVLTVITWLDSEESLSLEAYYSWQWFRRAVAGCRDGGEKMELLCLHGDPEGVTVGALSSVLEGVGVDAGAVLFKGPSVLFPVGLDKVLKASVGDGAGECIVACDVRSAYSLGDSSHFPYYTLGGFMRFAEEMAEQGMAEPSRNRVFGLFLGPGLMGSNEWRDVPVWELPFVLPEDMVSWSRRWVIHPFDDYYSHSRRELLDLIPGEPKRVLDIGCGTGAFGELLRSRLGALVVGVELDEQAAALASKRLDVVVQGDICQVDLSSLGGDFDLICCNDLLEHVGNPVGLLNDLKTVVSPGGYLFLSIPNLLHGEVVCELLSGRWDYVPAGPLCYGHLRFFTMATIDEMLAMAGWKVVRAEPLAGPLSPYMAERVQQLRASGLVADERELERIGYIVVARSSGGQ